MARRLRKVKFQSRSDAGDGVSGGLEDLTELADGGVTKELGALTVGDVVKVEGDALVGGVNDDVSQASKRSE